MKSGKMQNHSTGNVPEYGAIFMSSSQTKKECLRRKLFGLSPKHGHFVKQIKVGMILFLFEYEKRQLHGVFEACSDGGMNIVPHAFSTSGIYCPAQVKVRSIWICDPLFEHEFCAAIEENYFAPKKFKFGLSEAQVSRLLQLFSSKKLGVPRRLTNSCNTELVVHSMDEGRQVDSSRSKVQDRINDNCVSGFNNVDAKLVSATTTGYPLTDNLEIGHSRYHFGDIPGDGEFPMNNDGNSGFWLGSSGTTEYSLLDKVELTDNKFPIHGPRRHEYSPNTELCPAVSQYYPKYLSKDVERFQTDDRFSRNDEFQNEYKDSGFEPVLREYSSLLPSKLSRSILSRKSLEVRNSVSDQTTTQPSQIHHQMHSLPGHDLSPKVSYRDAIVVSTHPYNSVAPRPSLDCRHPLADEFNSRYGEEVCQPYIGYPDEAISLSKRQPFASHLEQKEATEYGCKISTLGDNALLSGPTHSGNTYHDTMMGFPQTSYSKNLDGDPKKNQCFNGLFWPKYSEEFTASIRNRTDTRENKFSTCYPLSNSSMYTAKQVPSVLDDYSYQVEPGDHLQHEATQQKQRDSSMSNKASAYEDPFTLQGQPQHDPQSLQQKDHALLEYDPEHYQLNIGTHVNRTNVFSRLTFAQDTCVPEDNPHVGYEDIDTSTSKDEVMEMLHHSHRQWIKSKKPKPWKRQDDAEKFFDRKETVTFHEGVLHGPKRLVKDKRMDISPVGCNIEVDVPGSTEQVVLLPEVKPFLNFKRRSEMQKLHGNDKTSVCDTSSRNEGVLGGPQKKRKLIRPTFGKSVLSDDKDANNFCSTLQALPAEIPFAKDTTGHCEAAIVNQNYQNTSSFEISKETCLIGPSGKGNLVFDSESREAREGSCIKSLMVRVEVGEESSINNANALNDTISRNCESKNPDVLKDSPNDCDVIRKSLALEPLLEAETKNHVEANDCQQNRRVELLTAAHGAIMDRINNSLGQFYKMQQNTIPSSDS